MCYNLFVVKDGKNILLEICGGVAAYKAAFLARLLRKESFGVQAVMSPASLQFVGAATLQALTGKPVATDSACLSPDGMDHISLPRSADILLVAPATADFLAKAASGAADNLLLSSFLAADCPRLVAPAMNRQMWQAATTQRNVRQLVEDGVMVLPPDSGEQACGETGEGRMMEPEDIARRIRAHFDSPLSGVQAVVSTGATREKIDDMRVVSNISSGKMGFHIAESLAAAGAKVQIIAGQTSVPAPTLPICKVESAEEMKKEVLTTCKNANLFVSAAAVSDFRPRQPTAGKIPRQKGGMVLQLIPSEDILAATTAKYPDLFTVGFAAQSGTAEQRNRAGREKMRRKGTNMFAVNPSQDAGGESSELTILTATDEIVLPRQGKRATAAILVEYIAKEIVSRETIGRSGSGNRQTRGTMSRTSANQKSGVRKTAARKAS